MTKSTTDKAAEDLGKTMSDGKAHAQDSPREPQEESLKHHGDDLQNVLDKATGATPAAH